MVNLFSSEFLVFLTPFLSLVFKNFKLRQIRDLTWINAGDTLCLHTCVHVCLPKAWLVWRLKIAFSSYFTLDKTCPLYYQKMLKFFSDDSSNPLPTHLMTSELSTLKLLKSVAGICKSSSVRGCWPSAIDMQIVLMSEIFAKSNKRLFLWSWPVAFFDSTILWRLISSLHDL